MIEYLRPFGILNRPERPTIADQWITRFDEYCRRVRGLAVSTRTRYFRFVRLFVTRIAGDGQPDWSTLTGHDVAQFAKTELAKVRVLKKTIVTSLRSFLRFLISEGLIARGLLGAIPRIRCWRYANLAEPLTVEQHAKVTKNATRDWVNQRLDALSMLTTLSFTMDEADSERPRQTKLPRPYCV